MEIFFYINDLFIFLIFKIVKKYEIEVKTADDLSAGTDAEVFISIFGDKAILTDLPIKQSLNNKDPFERAKLDKFVIEEKNVGKISKINIGHNSDKTGSSWKLEYVQITIEKEVYRFEINKWLENPKTRIDVDYVKEEKASVEPKKEETPITQQQQPTKEEKKSSVAPTAAPKDSSQSKSPALKEPAQAKQATYEIEIKTADDLSAGTDANVFLTIFGSEGSFGDVQLKDTESNKNAFETGNLDRFIMTGNFVGTVKKIKIGHDAKKAGSSWKIEYVKIECNKTVYSFEMNKWLESPQLSIEFEPTSTLKGKEESFLANIFRFFADNCFYFN